MTDVEYMLHIENLKLEMKHLRDARKKIIGFKHKVEKYDAGEVTIITPIFEEAI